MTSFDWVMVTPKMHLSVCHATAFLRRFGSLGRYSEQALEAPHGRFNQEAALYTAGTFLGSCSQLFKLAAMSRPPDSGLYNNGPTRKTVLAGARVATCPDDGRLRANKAQNGAPGKSTDCKEKEVDDVAM